MVTSQTNSPKHLTLDEKLQVACYHSSGSKHPLWVVDSTHGHPVCSYCGKPAPDLVLRICVEPDCGIEFVMNFGLDWVSKYYVTQEGKVVPREIYCPTCY